MRTRSDRIRHAVSFEVIALAIVTPMGALIFAKPLLDIGVVTIVSSLIAMGWNFVYNLGFDHALLALRGNVRKTVVVRIGHAVLFEAGLLLVLVPFIAWYLGIGWIEAFLIDIAFAAFFLVYAFVFNWAYDVIYPLPGAEPRSE